MHLLQCLRHVFCSRHMGYIHLLGCCMIAVSARPVQKKLVIVTGANSGIGKETSRRLAAVEGYSVLMACRNVTAGVEAAADIVKENPDASVECSPLDLASFSSVRAFICTAVKDRPVTAVVHNAGVMAPPFTTTVDGYELTFQVNHLAPFYLTKLLLPNLRNASKRTGELSRVVLVSSSLHRWAAPTSRSATWSLVRNTGILSRRRQVSRRNWALGCWQAYADTKLCNVLHAAELTRRHGDRAANDGLFGVAVRPGTVRTGIVRHNLLLKLLFTAARRLLTSIEEAGDAVANAVIDSDILPGGYYDRRILRAPSHLARDRELQAALWEETEDFLSL